LALNSFIELALFSRPIGRTLVQVPTASTARTKIRRVPARAVYDRETIDAILDEALVAHLGFLHDGQPYVVPTLHARIGDAVYFHGSAAGRAIRTLGEGVPACLTVTLLDGLVLARSAVHHSVNYRSVVVLGKARPLVDRSERAAALEAFVERLVPARWGEVRPPSPKELKATGVLALPLDEVSAKTRAGPPVDDRDDYVLDSWAGVIPLRMAAGVPAPDPRLAPGTAASSAVQSWIERHR
jgi:nitroimidazol reductase NimA-like FMN-containing flavoprotein (pyridoxamine 5'-phosphate oxidase superfamily)